MAKDDEALKITDEAFVNIKKLVKVGSVQVS